MRRVLLLLLAGIVLAASPAAATPLQKLLTSYGKTQVIDPCKHSTKQLQAGVSAMTPALIKARPLFYAALQTALSTRQAGLAKCTSAAARAPGGTAAPNATPTIPSAAPPPTVVPTAPAAAPPAQPLTTLIPQPPPQVQTTTEHKISVPALLLAGLLLAFALLALLATALTSGGRAPRGLEDSRHAFGEAAFRARQAMREFGDWVRLGR